MSITKRLAALLSFCAVTGTLGAQVVDSIPTHDTFVLHSTIVSEARTINIHTPAGYGTGGTRYAVLYMPDGGVQEDFPHVVVTVDSLVALGKLPPLIIVGIENTQRRRDMTGPTSVGSDSAIAPRVGGSAAFRGFIRDELIPEIARRYRTTDDRGIIGESLVGLFVTETFLLEPELFRRYIALDPSLWWNAGALLTDAARGIPPLRGHRVLSLSAANTEGIGPETARLAATLRERAPRDLTLVYTPRPDLDHGTIYRGEGAEALIRAYRDIP
jgi:predicted alpha/beta superfamily hydrolase